MAPFSKANLSLSTETGMSNIDTPAPAHNNLSALYFSVLNVEMAFASRGRELLPLYCCLKSTSPPSLWLIDRILAARSLSLVLQYYLCSPACYHSYPGLSGAKQGMLDTSSFAGEYIHPFRWELYWLEHEMSVCLRGRKRIDRKKQLPSSKVMCNVSVWPKQLYVYIYFFYCFCESQLGWNFT